MKWLLQRLRPDSLSAQIALVLFLSIALFQTVVTSTYLFTEPEWRQTLVEPGEAIASAVLAIDVADQKSRAEILADLQRSLPWARFIVQDSLPSGGKAPPANSAGDFIRNRLWPEARVRVPAIAMPTPNSDFAVALRRGGAVVISILEPRRSGLLEEARRGRGVRRFFTSRNLERSAALFLVSSLLLTLWLSFAVVAPLYRLVRQAEKFPFERRQFEPLAESGPKEMRELSRALNRMQQRIDSMIESRRRALAAISHDLRTIITRMRLRSEFIADESLKAKMLNDVESMDSMLHKNLVYLRGEESGGERGLIDLDSVLQTIADEFVDLGHNVSYQGGKHQTVYGSIGDLQRLFSNLVENAVKHGDHVSLSASAPQEGFIVVDVADDGPGIPADQKQALLEPFTRGAPARTMDGKSGFGLGLSIVASLVGAAGGTLQLLDREPTGLVARVALPAAFR